MLYSSRRACESVRLLEQTAPDLVRQVEECVERPVKVEGQGTYLLPQ